MCNKSDKAMFNKDFKSIRELIKAFPDEQTCINHLEELRWSGNVVSPFDETSKVYNCAGNKYKCKNTGKYFNVRTSTLFDNTKIELQTWFIAIYLLTGHKKGISSLQLSRDLNVTQKTAWFMAQRIRNCYGLADNEGSEEKMGGGGQLVETDETYPGGKAKNFGKKKRKMIEHKQLDVNANKTTVMGYLVRGGKLRMKVLNHRNQVAASVLENVASDAVLMTDASGAYHPVRNSFAGHEVIDHAKKEYVNGALYTNGIEGAFSLFDRGVIGIYHYVSPKHMQKYVDEFSFRYNTRGVSDCSRFNQLLSFTTKRLTYKNLTK